MRFTSLKVALFLAALALPGALLLGMASLAFDKSDLTEHSALLLVATSLLGSHVNLPLLKLPGGSDLAAGSSSATIFSGKDYRGSTLIALNVGGCLVPVGFCAYLITHMALEPLRLAAVVTLVAAISYHLSRLVPGRGIAVLFAVPSIVAAVFAFLFNPGQAAPTAYIGGTLGVLIGADLLRLGSIQRLRAQVVSIGGGGTFDAVFVTGLLAAMLA